MLYIHFSSAIILVAPVRLRLSECSVEPRVLSHNARQAIIPSNEVDPGNDDPRGGAS